MRIGQVAEAAGVTQRTVRYYHRLGLLPEPDRRANGYRDYPVDDVVRLLRIRWLAESGVPLGSVAAVLEAEATGGASGSDEGSSAATGPSVVGDLQALLRAERAALHVAELRCARLTRMLQAAESGHRISALPAEVSHAFSAAESAAESAAVAAAVRRDRDAVEALVISGCVPDEALQGLLDHAADPHYRAWYLAALTRWTALHGQDPSDPLVGAEIAAVAVALAGVTRHLVPSPPAATQAATPPPATIDPDVLVPLVPDRAQREALLGAVRILTCDAAASGS